MSIEIWKKSEVITWSQLLLNSYSKFLGKELIERTNNIEEAKILWFLPFVVVSHGLEMNPIFNYGNQIALTLWQMNWEEFTQTTSKSPVDFTQIEERDKMLKTVRNRGFIDNYRGIRCSSTGKKFLIENVIVWNIVDTNNQFHGQAATFSKWTFL
ncbi:MEKHLA domain-containing protein [Cyanobacterium sp. uoEpiScrs1]|uniref:MEKHLA domain-containing protein n=1 Tax=Cyanobacterium sp. uoEpiScrs1 TaxID=2976343 RepID=UPI00226A2D9E|nr:MEKHLA domain-containing protein [Cyanobacterium sp. uoEpiScrs1]